MALIIIIFVMMPWAAQRVFWRERKAVRQRPFGKVIGTAVERLEQVVLALSIRIIPQRSAIRGRDRHCLQECATIVWLSRRSVGCRGFVGQTGRRCGRRRETRCVHGYGGRTPGPPFSRRCVESIQAANQAARLSSIALRRRKRPCQGVAALCRLLLLLHSYRRSYSVVVSVPFQDPGVVGSGVNRVGAFRSAWFSY